MKMKKKTHYNQMITAKTRKLLEKLCKISKLSKPMQLEVIVEQEHANLQIAHLVYFLTIDSLINQKRILDHWTGALIFFLGLQYHCLK